MGWNPETYDFCHGCSHYESVGQYVYEMNSAAKRRCKHLARCRRVAETVKKFDKGQQMVMDNVFTHQKG